MIDKTEPNKLKSKMIHDENELAELLMQLKVNNENYINKSNLKNILELLRSSTTSLSKNESLLDSLITGILKSKMKHDENRKKIENLKVLLMEAQKDDHAKNEFIKKLWKSYASHANHGTKTSHANTISNLESASNNDNFVFTGRGTKYAMFGTKNKETVSGKNVVVAPRVKTKDVLKEGKTKMLRANIVLPDATNVNTHIADVVETPGKICYSKLSISNN